MPSEDLPRLALDAVGGRMEAFRSTARRTADQLRGYLADHRARGGGAAERAAATLGAFAGGRIDPARFSRLFEADQPAGAWAEPVQCALEVLEELEERGEDLFRVRVEPGGDLHAAVERALGEAGRAFGAARVAGLARSGGFRAEDHRAMLEFFSFRRWSAAERNLAPPLVIEVEGGDLLVGGLSAYLDGAQQLVLLVDGPAPPAALVRLVTPGVLVMQSDDAGALARLARTPGPAVAAVVPAEAGRFVHEPAAGDGAGRIEVDHLPAEEPRHPLGALSAFQQRDDLRLLVSLAQPDGDAPPSDTPATPAGAAASVAPAPPSDNGGTPAPPADPAGALAAWLLSQADLTDLETEGR